MLLINYLQNGGGKKRLLSRGIEKKVKGYNQQLSNCCHICLLPIDRKFLERLIYK